MSQIADSYGFSIANFVRHFHAGKHVDSRPLVQRVIDVPNLLAPAAILPEGDGTFSGLPGAFALGRIKDPVPFFKWVKCCPRDAHKENNERLKNPIFLD